MTGNSLKPEQHLVGWKGGRVGRVGRVGGWEGWKGGKVGGWEGFSTSSKRIGKSKVIMDWIVVWLESRS
jgi:hypothetical protein